MFILKEHCSVRALAWWSLLEHQIIKRYIVFDCKSLINIYSRFHWFFSWLVFSVKTSLSLSKYFHGSYDLRNEGAHWKIYTMFSSLSGKICLFFSLEFRWNVCIHVCTCTHEFVCIGGWSKHKTTYLGLCFLVVSWTSNAKLICWPFLIFWKMHSRWKLNREEF